MVERLEDDFMRPRVQLLHFLAVDVPLVRATQDINQPGLRDFARNHFRRKREVVQDSAEGPRRLRKMPLLIDDVTLDRDDRLTHAQLRASAYFRRTRALANLPVLVRPRARPLRMDWHDTHVAHTARHSG